MKNNFTMGHSRRGKFCSSELPVRRTLISLVCCLVVLLGTTAYGQQRTYDVNYENRTIISVLEDLRSRTGFLFLHKDGVIPESQRVTVSLTDATLTQVLDKVLVDNGYQFRIDGRDVVISKAPAPRTESVASQIPQTVTGTVSDEQQQPLPGVSVMIFGQDRGVLTDASGKYSIEIVGDDVLQFSYLGMNTVYTRPGTRSVVNITLQEQPTEIEQAVVIGYGSARKLGSMAGSVATVGGDQIKNAPVANFSDALQGKVAGLSVLSESGEPSSTSVIRLRGVNSILASTDPLYILDGSPVSQVVFHSLNPGDIENIVTLKDASATAIYGSRAANGVIAITTKKGRNNQEAVISLRAQYGISQLVGDKVKMMNSEQYFRFREMLDPDIANEKDWQRHKELTLSNGISTDWTKYIFRDNAPTLNLDASIYGGGENINYFLSMNHNSMDGIMPTSESHRTSLRSNLEARVRPWIKVGLNTHLAYLKFNENPDVTKTAVYSANPATFARFARPDDSPWYITENNDGTVTFGDRADYLHESKILNPLFIETTRKRKRQNVSIMANLYEEFTPVKGLILRTAQAIDAFDYTYSSQALPVPDFITPMGDEVIYNEGKGQARETFQRYYSFTLTNTLEYKLHANNLHHTTFLLGQEAIITKDRSYDVNFTGLTDRRLMMLSNSTDYTTPVHLITDRVFNSAFVRVDYNYDYKYYLELTYRVDGSSKFGPNNRWAEFYSVGGKWDLKRESFLAETRLVDELGLRMSYGTTGNSSIPDYRFYGLVNSGNVVYEGENGMINAQSPNPNLSWETVTKFNVGVDFRLFDKLTGSVEYYRNKTSDMLMFIPYSSTTGFSAGYGNIGGMLNTGVDLTLGMDLVRSKDFYWEFHANGNYNKNKITELFHGLDEYILAETGIKLQVGKPYGEFFIVRRKEVDPRDGKQIWLDAYGNETKTYSESYETFVKKQRFAPFTGGFGTFFSYKDLSLQADFSFALGKYAINNDMYFFENAFLYGQNRNQSVRMLDMWTTPGQRTEIPAATEQVYFDDHLLENASFLRLKTLQLSYSLPEKWMTGSKLFRRASVYALGRNLITVTKYTGYDPEPDSNVIMFYYPNTRQYVFGLELTF